MATKKIVENKYEDGTVAQRGHVVDGSDGGRYVVVTSKLMHSDGFIEIATIGTGFVRKVPIDTCTKCVPDEDEKQRAIETLEKVDKATRDTENKIFDRLPEGKPPEPPKAPAPEAVEVGPLFKGK